MEKAKRNVPELRFPGFTGAWEKHKLSDLVLIERGGSPRPIDDYITDAPDGMNWVKIGDAPSQGRYITKTTEKIKPEGLSKTRQVQPGDLILSNSMSFGKPYIMGINGCIHDGWLLIRNSQNRFDLKFLCHMLGTEQMLDQYRRFAAGSTVTNLNKELVGNTIVSLPPIEEQRVIGNFLDAIDNIISSHQSMINAMKEIKNGLLQDVFPKDGESLPKIRFPGFSGSWELHKLDDICSIITKQAGFDYSATIKPVLLPVKEANTYSFIQNKDFEGLSINLDTDFYIPIGTAEKYPKITIDQPSLLISISGRIGNVALYLLKEKAFIGAAVCICKLNDVESGKAVMYELMSPMGQKYISSLTKSSSHSNITVEDIRNLEVMLPKDRSETETINEFLGRVDALINLQQNKLDQMKEYKAGLLQKMFV